MSAHAKVTDRLRTAFSRNELTVYAGAGVSVASGLPNWSGLLRQVFLNSLRSIHYASDFSSLVKFQAVAEIWFSHTNAPLDLIARELKVSFANPKEFLQWVRFGLYAWLDCKRSGLPTERFVNSLGENRTLSAVAELCTKTKFDERGLRRVISYNFDNLLELRLGKFPHVAIWTATSSRHSVLPIYHVHGFLPARSPFTEYPTGTASRADQIVLTEDQYHRVASVPYAWSNLIQLRSLSDSVGLTVGLSMTDWNMRRLLDIAAESSVKPEIYSLLPRRARPQVSEEQLEAILRTANALARRDGRDPIIRTDDFLRFCHDAWQEIEQLALRRQVRSMSQLGVHPVWCDHEDIPDLLDAISRA